ncbi:hypothetical protein OCU04_008551 [Sclerotinia nivalis]|uniref:Uncharacterized protein n=1 Tax=Sclerotinia nivalis TaxID=352851 RepID=A0A9X0AIA4_9HELO|nr:hypothetical protein OCU04_008551 [Sclerotinia nivalis]
MDTWNRCFIISPIGEPYILDDCRFKFLKYAADNWMTHYEKSPGNIDLQTIVDICSPTIRRSIWFQACLGGEYPPKHFQNIAYTISNSLKANDFEETRAMSTLMVASCLGFLDIAKTLLTTPLSHSEICQYWNNKTALSFAIINGDYKMTELLISAGANIDDNDSNGEVQSALEVAVEHKQSNIIYLLLDNKAGTHAALITAAREYFVHWQPGIFGLILARKGALVPHLRARLLEIAISMHNPTDVVRAIYFVQECPHEPSVSETMSSPLFLVLSRDPPNIDACSLIINDSAIHDIDNCWRSNGSSSSGVYFIASLGEVRLLKLLTARGASLDMDSNGSAFYQAVNSGNVECVKFFIEEDPGISTLYINGNINYSPILNAVEKGNHNMVRYLIEHGADASRGIGHWSGFEKELYYFTILTAVEMGKTPKSSGIVKRDTRQTLIDLSIQQIEELIGYGFDINCEVRGGIFLSHAASSGNLDRVKWLIDHGANVDGHFSGGRSILSSPLMEAIWGCDGPSSGYKVCNGPIVASSVHLAIIKDDVEVLRILLEHNADVNLQGDKYGIPLKEATANGQVNLMRLLVSHGADVNAIGQGIPVLHEAIFNRQLEAVAALLDLGAYINIIDYVRGTPLQLAEAMHYPEMVSLLQRRGAIEVCNLKSAGTSYFCRQARGHTSTASLVLSRKEIETPDSDVFSRRRSVALQTWATYGFDYHGEEFVSIFSEGGFFDDVSKLCLGSGEGKGEEGAEKGSDDESSAALTQPR